MSWKNETDARGWSLAVRLSAWYAASAFLLLLVATGFLYWALVRSFDREDDQYLSEKINVLRTLLPDRSRNAGTVQWEVEGESSTRPSARVLSRVLWADGRILVETNGMSRELPASVFPEQRNPASGVEVHSSGKTFRILSAGVPGASPDHEAYRIQVAIDLTYEANLLAGYRRQLWGVLGLGLIASVLVGHRIGHRGLRPVKQIGAAMQRIGSATLGERVEIAGLPAELSALAVAFNQMLDRLEEAFVRLSRFSADIAHELRTPINNLRGEVEVALAKARSPEEYREALGSSLEECLRLSRLIESLLFLARAEHPATQIRVEPLEVARELDAVRDFYEAAANDAGVSLDLETPGGATAHLDRTLFQRAVANLIENALAHTPSGGVIKIEATEKDGLVLVSVSDTGCGIPADHLPHVFDRFYRVDAARSAHEGGAGLGLPIVESVARLHGGKAEISSEPGHGTRVTLVFPQMTKS